MASSPNTSRPLQQPLASRLKDALDVYGHITPPNEQDDGDCTRFIGRCLVELNLEQQQYTERLQVVEQHARGSPYDGPTFSSQNDKIDGIWEEIGELKIKVDNIEDKAQEIQDKVQDVEDKLISIEEKSEEQFNTLQAEIGDLGTRVDSLETKVDSLETKVDSLETKVDSLETKVDSLETKVDSLETKVDSLETKVDSLETKVDSLKVRLDSLEVRFDSLEVKFDKFMFEQDAWGLRQRNSLAARLYQPVQPVGISYIDANGRPVCKLPTQPVKTVGYYWKMHNRENHKKLIDAHRFYQLDFRHWALGDDEGSDNSYETDDLDFPLTTLEQAVSMYPDRAVMALFNELGLVYSRFQEQVERQQLQTTALQKRSPEDTSSKSKRRMKKPSDGSTTEILTELLGSSTASAS